jgi:hypothetical protein
MMPEDILIRVVHIILARRTRAVDIPAVAEVIDLFWLFPIIPIHFGEKVV